MIFFARIPLITMFGLLLMASLGSVTIAPISRAEGLEGEDALSLAIARGDAVFSGRFRFKLEQSVGGPITEYELVLMGSSWKRRFVHDFADLPVAVSPEVAKLKVKPADLGKKPEGQVETIEVSHNGMTVEYKSCPQLDGTVTRTSRVVAGERSPNRQTNPFPHLLGSFWFVETKEFVANHRKNAIHSVRARDNNGIDIYEFPVSKQNVRAFRSVNELTRDGGTLRIYVSAEMGGTLTRIEHVGAAGVGAVLEADDFIEVNGIYMPRKCRLQYFTPQGTGYWAKYTFSEVKDINKAVPDREFVIELPVGTIVADARDPKASKFFEVTGPDAIPPDLENVYIPAGGKSGWFMRWWWAVSVGAVMGLVAVSVLRLVRRRAWRGATS